MVFCVCVCFFLCFFFFACVSFEKSLLVCGNLATETIHVTRKVEYKLEYFCLDTKKCLSI